MRAYRAVGLAGLAAIVVTLVASQGSAQAPGAVREFSAPVAPMFEGWYRNPDGTATVLVGFFNPNQRQTVDLPIGELNRFSPSPEDRGQPTHFPPGRAWGVLSIQVPGDFDGDLTWTLTANNRPASIPVHLRPPYFIEPFKDAANANEPPTIRFAPDGETFTGPPVGIARTLTARVGAPVKLSVWTSDVTPPEEVHAIPGFPRPALTLRWHRHRGPAEVEFGEPVMRFQDSADQNPMTTATFSAPANTGCGPRRLTTPGWGAAGSNVAGRRRSSKSQSRRRMRGTSAYLGVQKKTSHSRRGSGPPTALSIGKPVLPEYSSSIGRRGSPRTSVARIA